MCKQHHNKTAFNPFLNGLQNATCKQSLNVLIPNFIGMLNIPPGKMALAMMEAIAEFSKKNNNTAISLVRVVIFQEEMVATYLEQMEKAMKPGSSIMGMVTAPFRYLSDTIKGRHKKTPVVSAETFLGDT